MLSQIPLLSLTLLGSALANPISSREESQLLSRQNKNWNDDVIDQPRDFKATKVSACTYQIAYIRDHGEGRYDKEFQAFDAAGNLRIVSGRASANNFEFWAEYVGFLIVWHVTGACSNGNSGAEPSAFRVRFKIKPGFTNKNDWTSAAFAPSAGPLPAILGDVKTVRESKRTVRVSWTPVANAAGYLIKSSGLTDSEVGDVRYWTEDKVAGGSTTSGVANGSRLDRIAVLAYGPDSRVVSDFTQTPIVYF